MGFMRISNKHQSDCFHQGIDDQSRCPFTGDGGAIVGDGAPDENNGTVSGKAPEAHASELPGAFMESQITNQKQPNPPMLTGGLKPENINMGNLADIHFDFLTVLVSSEGRSKLLKITQFAQMGHPIRGFNKSEKRLGSGGYCWRKMEPLQEEKRFGFGRDYECWEFPGFMATTILPHLIDVKCKVTRIDIAFDYYVNDDYFSDNWIDDIKQYSKSKGISDGISGQNDINTRYVGSDQSQRRIRVYRKDLQMLSPKPLLRIELVLKDEYVLAFWPVVCESFDKAYRVAAKHIEEMTSFIPIPENLETLPHIEKKVPSNIIKRLFYFIKQYGVFAKVCQNTGIGIQSLIDHKYEKSLNDKVSRHRAKILNDELAMYDSKDIESVIYDAIDRGAK
jgi:hypothetical protein